MTIAGRYLVLLPFPSQQGGVSRRVALGQERMKLKKLLAELRTDQYSFIVRTAGLGVEEEQIRSDVELLTAEWHQLVERFRSMKGPGLVYSDHDIVNRLVRDAFKPDIDQVVVDDEEMAEALRTTLARSLPELVEKVIDYDGREPIFSAYQVDAQLEKALNRKVWLKSGGYLIIDEAEALTAIDVNSGRFTGSKDQEKTSLRTNMEACEAIAQQIRLRDIGGIIVIDFIDMLSREHQQRVADELKHQMRHDRAKYTIGRLGDFGLMMMTRKRKHQSLQKQVFDPCPYCKGEGRVLCADEVWRRIRRDLEIISQDKQRLSGVILCTNQAVLTHLQSDFAPFLEAFTKRSGLEVILRADPTLHLEDYTVTPIRRPEREAPQLPAVRIAEDDVMQPIISYDKRPAAVELKAAAPAAPKPGTDRQRPAPPAKPASTPLPPTAAGSDDETPSAEEAPRRTRRGRRGGRRRRGGLEVGHTNGQLQDASSVDGTPLAEELELEDDVLNEAVNFVVDNEAATRTDKGGLLSGDEAAARVEEAARVSDEERRKAQLHVRFERRRTDRDTITVSSMPTPVAETPATTSTGLLTTGKVRIVNNWGTAQASPVFKKMKRTSAFAVATAAPPEKPHVPMARKITVIGTWGVSPHPGTKPGVSMEEPIGPTDPAQISIEAQSPAAETPPRKPARRGRRAPAASSAAKASKAAPAAAPAPVATPEPAKPEPAKPAAKAAPKAASKAAKKSAATTAAKAAPEPAKPAAKKAAKKAATTAAEPKATKKAAKKSTSTTKAAATTPATKKAAETKAPATKKAAVKSTTKKAATKSTTKKAAKKAAK
jgi:Rne/Rng family ribonuclease